jgi:hypothetical protein
VLRVPGFLNLKRETPFRVAVAEGGAPAYWYTLEEIAAAWPAVEEAGEKYLAPAPEFLTNDNARLPPESLRKRRYTAWLEAHEEVPEAGKGSRNGWYFSKVAAAVRDFAIEDDEWILDTLTEHSEQHHGAAAYDYDDFRKLLKNAKRSASRPVGEKVAAAPFIPTVGVAGTVATTAAAAAEVVPMVNRRATSTEAGGGNKSKSDEKLAKVRMLTTDALLAYEQKYRMLVGDDGVAVPLELDEPGVVRPVNPVSLVRELTKRYSDLLLPSTIRADLAPAVMAKLPAVAASQIRPFRFASDKLGDLAWMRLPFDPDPTAECPPEFRAILDRTSSPAEARSLVLWIGSLLDYESPRKQYVHLSGDGNDGKSTLTNMLVRVFGSRNCAEMRAEDFRDTHATTVLEGARLVIFHDENNAGFMSGGRFKALTGDEMWTINPKGQPRRDITLNCKVIISSNNRPEVHGGKADLDRIVPVYLRSYEGGQDPGFVSRLYKAKHQVMQFCYAEWVRHKETGGLAIPSAEDTLEEVMAFSSRASAEEIIDRWFEAKPGAQTITPTTAQKFLHANEPAAAKQAFMLLRKQYKIVRPGRGQPRVFNGLTFRTTES